MYKAHATRASDQSDLSWPSLAVVPADNTPLIEDTLRLRHERAELLGYRNHAELSCASKMATVDQAMDLIEELREVCRCLGSASGRGAKFPPLFYALPAWCSAAREFWASHGFLAGVYTSGLAI